MDFGHFARIGIQWLPEEFVEASLRLGHPFELQGADDGILKANFWMVVSGRKEVCKWWTGQLEDWKGRAAALAEKETKSASGQGEMLDMIKFPLADGVVHTLFAGFPLVGRIPPYRLLRA